MSNYIDRQSTLQVLGCLYKHPHLFDQVDKYYFSITDFVDSFHKIIFNSIHSLKTQGLIEITPIDIENYLLPRPSIKKIFTDNKGFEFLEALKEYSDLNNFNYYFNRLKKFTILRAFDDNGIDVSWLYNTNSLVVSELQKQEDQFDSYTIEQILNLVNQKIEDIKLEYLGKTGNESSHVSDGLNDLIERLKETPEVGIPLYGSLINTISRGARLKKFYLRSAPTGVGKTRMMIADAVNFATDEIYDIYENKYIANGISEPTLFITTELEIDEIQTMALAFLSAIPEENILNGEYTAEQKQQMEKAIQIMNKSSLWIEHLPDFSLRDIESVIRRNVRDNGVKYICFDYIHTSLKILEEITQRTSGMKLREDNILFMLAIKIKDLCNELGIFVLSGTQLNADWEDRTTSNQNVLRGAKAIADKIDLGIISLPVNEADKEALQSIVASACLPMPNIVHHVYKNRRSKYKFVKLWCSADFSTCRVTPLFMTDNDYKIIEIEDFDIVVQK